MVHHDQKRVEAGGDREISNKITEELAERERGRGGDRGQWRGRGMCIHLILLTNRTSSDIGANKGG